MDRHASFWIGFFAAVLIIVPAALVIMGAAEDHAETLAIAAMGGVIGMVLLLVIVLTFRGWILRKVTGRAEVAVTDVSKSLISVVSAASVGDREKAEEEVQVLASRAVGWYSWTNFYRWVIATAIGLLLAFGAFVGTVLLFEQVRLLSEQTKRFATQTDLMSAQTALMTEQSNSLKEQNAQVAMQNEIMTVSLVSQLREQLFRSAQPINADDLVLPLTGPLNETNDAFVSRDGNCVARYVPGRELRRTASQSTILAMAKLAQDGQMAGRVKEALKFLVEDSDSAVALGAASVLDVLGEEGLTLTDLDGLFVNGLRFENAHTLEFNNSILFNLKCPKCSLEVFGSGLVDVIGKDIHAASFEISSSVYMNVEGAESMQTNGVSLSDTILLPRDPQEDSKEFGDATIPFDMPFLTNKALFAVLIEPDTSFVELENVTSCSALSGIASRNRFLNYAVPASNP